MGPLRSNLLRNYLGDASWSSPSDFAQQPAAQTSELAQG